MEKIRVIRDLGHILEDIDNQEKNPPKRAQESQGDGSGKRKKGSRSGSNNDEKSKGAKAQENKSGSKKRKVELKGIPEIGRAHV